MNRMRAQSIEIAMPQAGAAAVAGAVGAIGSTLLVPR